MTRIESLAITQRRDHNNAPTSRTIIELNIDSLTEISGLVVDNRHLALIADCAPICHASAILTTDDGTTHDAIVGQFADPDEAANEIDRFAIWLTGASLTRGHR